VVLCVLQHGACCPPSQGIGTPSPAWEPSPGCSHTPQTCAGSDRSCCPAPLHRRQLRIRGCNSSAACAKSRESQRWAKPTGFSSPAAALAAALLAPSCFTVSSFLGLRGSTGAASPAGFPAAPSHADWRSVRSALRGRERQASASCWLSPVPRYHVFVFTSQRCEHQPGGWWSQALFQHSSRPQAASRSLPLQQTSSPEAHEGLAAGPGCSAACRGFIATEVPSPHHPSQILLTQAAWGSRCPRREAETREKPDISSQGSSLERAASPHATCCPWLQRFTLPPRQSHCSQASQPPNHSPWSRCLLGAGSRGPGGSYRCPTAALPGPG